jgi:hypothetical protein
MGALPYGAAKLLTSEKFVRWLSDGVKVMKTSPQDMSTHLSRLMVLRFREDIQEDVDNVIRTILDQKQ